MGVSDSISSAFYTQIILLAIPLSILGIIKLTAYLLIRYSFVKKDADEMKVNIKKAELTKGPYLEKSSETVSEEFDVKTVKRRSENRGLTDLGWLKSYHTFSYGKYKDNKFPGYAFLRVLNEDTILAGKGFEPLLRHNYQILTIILKGELYHENNIGNLEIVRTGEVQLLSCDKVGVRQLEKNNSKVEDLKYIQLWIEPDSKTPILSNEYYRFALNKKIGTLNPVCLSNRRTKKESSLNFITCLNSDVNIYHCVLEPGCIIEYILQVSNRFIYIHHIDGAENILELNFEENLKNGDGAFITTLNKNQKLLCKNIGATNLSFLLLDMA